MRDSQARPCDIAVVGLACRFPGAPSVDAYWALLRDGARGIGPAPRERFAQADRFCGGFLDAVGRFDPDHFGIAPGDARAMDPQALLLLELGVELFHHAGYRPEELRGGAVGVFLGGRSQHAPDAALLAHAHHPIVAVGQNYLAANLSRHFDLNGACALVDTACSSALVAMHSAVLALAAGEIDAAVVGGVSLLSSDAGHRLFEQRGLLAPDGAFHLFDERANGTVLSEGAGLVMLKPLAAARAHGDTIYAVLKGLAVNNDGRTAGPSSPNFAAQQAVMRRALAQSGLRADDVRHVEANGSGSRVTDLLELKSIRAVYGGQSRDAAWCALGSVKPSIGHTLCAQGIAAFIKSVLMLHHRSVPPFLSGQQPMQHSPIERSRLRFVRETIPFDVAAPAVALNCFADGGTNVHAVLQAWEGPTRPSRTPLAAPVFARRRLDARTSHASARTAAAWPRYVAR